MTSKSKPPFIIPIFIPHQGCPQRCVFCNQHTITGTADIENDGIGKTIDQYLAFRNTPRAPTQVAFYGGNFLGLPPQRRNAYLEELSPYLKSDSVQQIRFSTRPDTVETNILDELAPYPVSVVEIGAQSMDDAVLRHSRRGHSQEDTVTAVRRLKQRDISVGVQLMVGLPGETKASAVDSARRVAALKPDFVRIYPTIVLSGSPLAGWFNAGRYHPLSLEAAIDVVRDQLGIFTKTGIQVIRIGLQASPELDGDLSVLAGPYHPAFGHMVYSRVFLDTIVEFITGKGEVGSELSIGVNPRNISRLRGYRNENITHIKNHFPIQRLNVETIPALPLDKMVIGRHTVTVE